MISVTIKPVTKPNHPKTSRELPIGEFGIIRARNSDETSLDGRLIMKLNSGQCACINADTGNPGFVTDFNYKIDYVKHVNVEVTLA